jgi:hypothetical protein
MAKAPPDSEDLAADIFGTAIYEASRPKKRDFQPWHKPRKQFVRHYQWFDQIERLLSDTIPDDNVLRYLGLPGVDLLDLRYFHDVVCRPKALQLRFLGFNIDAAPGSDFHAELNISLDEVRKLSNVDPRSDVISDDFCRLANKDSFAWQKALESGPYDVVNLDLCDGFCLHAPGALDDNHYNAINQLLTLQARSKRPWLLLLTTRAGREHLHDEVRDKLIRKYIDNLTQCTPFRDQSRESFKIEDEATLRAGIETSSGLLHVFLTALCKWMLGLAVGQEPPSEVEVKSVVGYRVVAEAADEDLMSLALRFAPTFSSGKDGLGLASRAGRRPDECALSAKILRRIAKRRDADAILKGDASLYEEMIGATAKLLDLARYDSDAFRVWVAER